MNSISIGRLVVVVLIAFVASFSTVFGDGVRTAEAKDIAELGAVMALYGSKAVAAGVTAAMSAALGFLTIPFKGTGINALKVGKRTFKTIGWSLTKTDPVTGLYLVISTTTKATCSARSARMGHPYSVGGCFRMSLSSRDIATSLPLLWHKKS